MARRIGPRSLGVGRHSREGTLMNVGMRLVPSVSLVWLALGTVVVADTRAVVDQTCPLCGTKFKATLAMSGTQFGQRLDLRPVGAIASPWPVAVCTKCGFVLFKEGDKDYTSKELETLRGLVNADEYKKLPADTPSYERLARLLEGLKRPPNEIAHAYLKASWQVEGQDERNRALLEKSRKWLETYLEKAPKTDEARVPAEILRGELLRRVGKFDEAKRQFERLGKSKDFAKEPFPAIIAQELGLIEAKDSSAQEIKRDKQR